MESWLAFGGSVCRVPHEREGLTELDVRSNMIEACGARALLAIPTLRTLSLFDNPRLGQADEAGAALSGGLHAASASLASLDLGACALDHEQQLHAMATALRAGAAPALSCLELFGNGNSLNERDDTCWRTALAALRSVRPSVDVAWKEPTDGRS